MISENVTSALAVVGSSGWTTRGECDIQPRKSNWIYAAAGYTFLTTYIFGGLFFGTVWHELGHALACLFFRIPFQISLTEVTVAAFPNPWVKMVVAFAGGLAEGLSSLIFFGCTVWLERLIPEQTPLKESMFFGFKLAFLTISFQGLAASILEGGFNELYKSVLVNNFPFWLIVCLACGVSALLLLRRKSLRL